MRRVLSLGGTTAVLGATATMALAGGGHHRATYEIDTSGNRTGRPPPSRF